MFRNEILKKKWHYLEKKLSEDFADGEKITLEGIIYLIGIQELGGVGKKFKKDDKLNLMHIAICKLLEPYGYYTFDFVDEEGWPHYKLVEALPPLKAGEQTVLMKQAVVQYFEQSDFFPNFE